MPLSSHESLTATWAESRGHSPPPGPAPEPPLARAFAWKEQSLRPVQSAAVLLLLFASTQQHRRYRPGLLPLVQSGSREFAAQPSFPRATASVMSAAQRSGSSRKGAWLPGMTSRRASGITQRPFHRSRAAVDVVLAPDEVDRRRNGPQLVVGEMVFRPPASEAQREIQVGPHRVAPAGHAHPGRDHVAELVRRPIEGCLPDDALHRSADGLCRLRGGNDPRGKVAQTWDRQQGEERIAPHARQRHRRHTDADHGGHPLRCVDRQAERPHPAQRRSNERRAFESQRVQHRRELRRRVRTKRPAGVRVGVADPKPGRSIAIDRQLGR